MLEMMQKQIVVQVPPVACAARREIQPTNIRNGVREGLAIALTSKELMNTVAVEIENAGCFNDSAEVVVSITMNAKDRGHLVLLNDSEIYVQRMVAQHVLKSIKKPDKDLWPFFKFKKKPVHPDLTTLPEGCCRSFCECVGAVVDSFVVMAKLVEKFDSNVRGNSPLIELMQMLCHPPRQALNISNFVERADKLNTPAAQAFVKCDLADREAFVENSLMLYRQFELGGFPLREILSTLRMALRIMHTRGWQSQFCDPCSHLEAESNMLQVLVKFHG